MDPGDGQDDLEKRKALFPEGIRIADHPDNSVVTAPINYPDNCGDQFATEKVI